MPAPSLLSRSYASLPCEAVDRDVRKPHERPTVGRLLCASKDDEVVEYALSRSRSLSPAMIAEYQTQLPDKRMLAARLREFYLQQAGDSDGALICLYFSRYKDGGIEINGRER